jgi:hypothetical protein
MSVCHDREGRQAAVWDGLPSAASSKDMGQPLRNLAVKFQCMWETSHVQASLTIGGDSLDPDAITSLLGTSPDKCHRAGERGSNTTGPVPSRGGWSISSEGVVPGSAPLDAHIRSLLERVTPDLWVWEELNRDYGCRIFVGWFLEKSNEMVELEPALLGSLADRHLSLAFDVYSRTSPFSELRRLLRRAEGWTRNWIRNQRT